MTKPQPSDEYTPEEAAARADELLWIMLNTPPQPHTGTATPAKPRKPPKAKKPAK